MNITEFASARNEQSQTISIFIKRHPEQFEGHTRKVGKTVELDEVALEILEKQYPLPRPVQLINGVDPEEHKAVMEELNKAQRTIIGLQSKITDYSLQIAKAEATQLLLEDKDKELQSVKTDLKREGEEKNALRDKLTKAEGKIERYEDAIKKKDQELRQSEKNVKEIFWGGMVIIIAILVLAYFGIL